LVIGDFMVVRSKVAKAVEHAATPGKGGKVLLKIGDR
jgi:hypothetical protein